MSHAKENDIEEGLRDPSPFDSQDDDNSSSASSSAQVVEINPWSARPAGLNVSVDDSLTAALAVVARLEGIDDCAEPSSLPSGMLSHGSNSPIMAADIGSEQTELPEGELPSEPEVHDSYGLEHPPDIRLEIGGDDSNIPPANTAIPKTIETSKTHDQTKAVGERDIEQGLAQISSPDPPDASLAQPKDSKFPTLDGSQEVHVIPATPPSSPASTTLNDGDRHPLPPVMEAAMMIAAAHSEQGELEMIGGGDDSSLSPVTDHEPLHHSIPGVMMGDGGTEPPFVEITEGMTGSNITPPVPTDIDNAVGPVPPVVAKEESGKVIKSPRKSKRLSVSNTTIAATEKIVAHERSVPADDIESKVEPIVEECIAAGPSSPNMFEGNGIQVMIQESPSTSSVETDLNESFYTAVEQIDEETEDVNEKIPQEELSISSLSKDSSVNVDPNAIDDGSFNQEERRRDYTGEADMKDTLDPAADQNVDKEVDEKVPQKEAGDCSNSMHSSVYINPTATNQANPNQQEGRSGDAADPDLMDTFDTVTDQDEEEPEEKDDYSKRIDSSIDLGTTATNQANSNQEEEQLDDTVAIDLSDTCKAPADQKSDKRAVDANEEVQQKEGCSSSTSNISSIDAGTLDKHIDQSSEAVEADLTDIYELTRVQKLEAIIEETSQEQVGSPSTSHDSSVEAVDIDHSNIRDQEDHPNKDLSPPEDDEVEDGLFPLSFTKMLSKVERDAQGVNSSDAAPRAQSSNSDEEVVEAVDIDQASIKDQEDHSNKVSSPPEDNEAEDGFVPLPFTKMLSNVEKDAQDVNSSDAAPQAQSSNSDDEVVDREVDDDTETVPLGTPATSVMLSTRLEVKDDDTGPPLPPAMNAAHTAMADVVGREKSNLTRGDGPEPHFPFREVMDCTSDGSDMPPIGLADIAGEESDDAIKQSAKSNAPPTAKAVVQKKMEPSTDYDNTTTASGIETTIEPPLEIVGEESLAPVPFNSTILKDSDIQKMPLLSCDRAPAGQNVDEEAQILEEEKQGEEERHSSSSSSISETNDQGKNEYVKPNTNVPDDAAIVDATAEPLLPWWGQRRTMILFVVIYFFAIAAAVAIGVSFPRDEVISVTSTSAPSTSPMPIFEPTTSPSTFAPTEVPSSSQVSSYTPTYTVLTKYVEPKRR